MSKIKNICIFGSYLPEYSRNKIIIDGLQRNGINVYQCQSGTGSAIKRYPELIKKFWKIRNNIQLIYVGFFGHLDMPLAWVLAKLTGKPLVFDMFYSMYDTYIHDRRSAEPHSIKAKSYAFIDKLSGSLADLIITDTNAHAKYFIKTIKIKPNKFRRLFVGGDDTIFKSGRKKHNKKITIEFHGYFTRLHGAEYFVEAAKKLENESHLKFLLIGTTSNYVTPLERFRMLKPKNMTYIPELSPAQLSKTISDADISIGQLGITEKAKSVITNKIFHGLACKTALIVGNCPASHELLIDKETAIFVKMGDVNDLVKKIKLLAQDSFLRNKIATNGYNLYNNKLTNKKLGQELLKIFESVFKTS